MMKIDENKEKRIEIFEDTMGRIHTSRYLYDACEYSKKNTKMIQMDDLTIEKTLEKTGKIVVVNDRTFNSCINETGKIAVLNFASATNPGGGVKTGSNAQEECLCRCSTLYPCLNQKEFLENFYMYHRNKKDPFYDNLALYTKDVLIFKTDTKLPHMIRDREEWKKVDVITSAAPNLRNVASVDETKLRKILYDRILGIIKLGINNDVDVLVLGAFGCGAFKNPPEIVSDIFYEILVKENYRKYFEKVIFAVFGVPNKDMINFEIFNKKFNH